MSFPGYGDKHDEESYITPLDYLEWRRRRGDLDGFVCPERVVILYDPFLYGSLSGAADVSTAGGRAMAGLHVLGRTAGRVGVLGGFGYGAPIAAQRLENLIALGAKVFISLGAAGSLQPDLGVGELVLCTGAVRDEGVSHHYLPIQTPVGPDRRLTEAFGEALADRDPLRSGMTWTIDAPYRETVAEVGHYRAKGVLTVEMEAAALFAVAAVRGVPIASAFCISDLLGSVTWEPCFDAPELRSGLAALADAAIEVLATFPSQQATSDAADGALGDGGSRP